MRSLLLVPITALVAAPAHAFEPADLVAHARELLGVPYNFGGRLSKKRPGIDCQGVLFYAAERTSRCGWKSFSAYPTRSVERAELGKRVGGLDPVASAKLDVAALRPGDIIMMVGFDENPAEPAIGQLDGRDVWVWHTGLYAGHGRWIVGDHFAGKAVETDLARYLRDHRDSYVGIFVTRMTDGPRPKRCRRHRKMQRPKN